MIVESKPEGSDLRGIVLHLGSFHTEMNFLGCIGHLMDSSGLKEMLETIYAPNAVVHMLAKWQGYCMSCTYIPHC